MASLADRPSLTLEVFLLDVSTNTTDRVNAWLESFRLGGGYVDQTAAMVNPVAAVAKGFVRDVDVRLLWQLLEKDNTAKVEFRQQAQILSGTSTKFTSGQIVEQPLIVREPQTGKDLVTQIDRRTIGLSLNLRATAFADGWHIEFDLSDSAISNAAERTTTFTGQRRIKDNDGFFLLTSFNRTVRDGANSLRFPRVCVSAWWAAFFASTADGVLCNNAVTRTMFVIFNTLTHETAGPGDGIGTPTCRAASRLGCCPCRGRSAGRP